MAIESMNDILSLITIVVFVLVPMYYLIKVVSNKLSKINARRYEKLMKEEDWHM